MFPADVPLMIAAKFVALYDYVLDSSTFKQSVIFLATAALGFAVAFCIASIKSRKQK
ncbi:hypothetical protein PS623_04623 [Pseudomonas fluorescens]|uniref:hypothetical protein n=1 Tax=Pseudomonas fluorescens TaxID=294 RepID=UPI001250D6B0|nr:hypothetical protein [Pseudomonas fluorescens]VVN27753.1 hypothetical protein PS623_04623 [Pseudomonas fluorescens]